ncbi:crossover junction endodeoxyribonuclease RuvC [Candidatus Falkowbacteria bacterium]|nr:crossover junction endodeoxyribonuclease RuvC [Candidatus Falkowbacteria bacterium]NCT54738.1 crossover junction endodeoxyribonuclease RuvC [Candidatus Falkowbacteria bacterium]
MAKIILGLDPGIADTGYGIISCEKGKLLCLAYGSIKTEAKKDLSKRLEILDFELKKLIKKYQPEVVAVEQLFFNKNVKTALIVGQARGVLLLRIKKSGLKMLEFTPGQVKQAVAAYGRASKNQVQKMVKIILGLKSLPQPDDAADALAIAICSSSFK